MAVPLLDLSRQYAYLKPALDAAVLNVYAHGKFILGPEVTELEAAIAKMSSCAYGIGVASGTDALLIALRACGVGPGDEVITSDFSFFASAGVISRLGATPVFVDCEADTYNMDATKLEAAITAKTKVIVPVHLFGQMADMDPIMAIARAHNLKVIEDAAQSIGAMYKGKMCGSIGDFGCFSFFPSKNLGGSGDGGMIVCQTEAGNDLCRMLRAHGEKPKYYHRIVGYNSRLDTLQAATLLVKLPYLRAWSEARIRNADRYDAAFAGTPNLKTPVRKSYATFHIYNQYTLASPKRSAIMDGLSKAGIGAMIYYPVPFHRQDCFANLGFTDQQLPNSTTVSDQVFSIPIYPELSEPEQIEVIDTIRRLAS